MSSNTGVRIDLARGEAYLGNRVVPVSRAGAHGELQVGGSAGTVLRPLTFGERSRTVGLAVAAPSPALAAAAEVRAAATLRAGTGEPLVLEVLALHLAGAGEDGLPSFAETALSVARAAGWTPLQLAEGDAVEIDRLAANLRRSAASAEWSRLLLATGAAEELAELRLRLAEGLLRRAEIRPVDLESLPVGGGQPDSGNAPGGQVRPARAAFSPQGGTRPAPQMPAAAQPIPTIPRMPDTAQPTPTVPEMPRAPAAVGSSRQAEQGPFAAAAPESIPRSPFDPPGRPAGEFPARAETGPHGASPAWAAGEQLPSAGPGRPIEAPQGEQFLNPPQSFPTTAGQPEPLVLTGTSSTAASGSPPVRGRTGPGENLLSPPRPIPPETLLAERPPFAATALNELLSALGQNPGGAPGGEGALLDLADRLAELLDDEADRRGIDR